VKNLVILLGLLLAPLALVPFGVPAFVGGRLGLSLVFAFTGLGHFVKHREMVEMLPPSFPARSAVICTTGLLEWLLAAAIWFPPVARFAGLGLCLFLIAVFPANVHAARARVPFGGHGAGLRYLWVRAPLQLVLIAWAYFFVVRK